jgi:hypothetical protein
MCLSACRVQTAVCSNRTSATQKGLYLIALQCDAKKEELVFLFCQYNKQVGGSVLFETGGTEVTSITTKRLVEIQTLHCIASSEPYLHNE